MHCNDALKNEYFFVRRGMSYSPMFMVKLGRQVSTPLILQKKKKKKKQIKTGPRDLK